jgi:hypothetical protein
MNGQFFYQVFILNVQRNAVCADLTSDPGRVDNIQNGDFEVVLSETPCGGKADAASSTGD